MARIRRRKSWGLGKKVKKRTKPRKIKKGPGKREALSIRRHKGPPPTLRGFQREGVDFLQKHQWKVLVADAPGAGKTCQTLAAIRENAATLCPALVVVPSSVAVNWVEEVHMWVPKARVQLLDHHEAPLRRGRHITVATWDMLVMRQDELVDHGFRLLVGDEIHAIKNPETQRSKAFRRVREKVDHCLGLSGTPLVNTRDELQELQQVIEPESGAPILRRLLEDVAPDIPPKRRVTLHASVPEDILHEYDRVVEVYEDWLQRYLPKVLDSEMAVDSASARAMESEPLSKLNYLRRVLGRGKVPAAAAWIRAMRKRDEPVVVFGQYRDVLSLLGQALAKLGIPYVRLDGGTTIGARKVAVRAFQAGKIDVFLASSAAKEGITLHRAAHMLFLERWYTSTSEEQAEDRIRRIGQLRPTTIWYLHVENTIDDRISEIVERKRTLIAGAIGLAPTEHTEHGEVLDIWRRLRELRRGVPLVEQNPTGDIQLPPLPNPRFVHAVLVDSRRWPLDAVQRHLRKGGFRQREIHRKGSTVLIVTRARTGFKKGSLKRLSLIEGLNFDMGKPVKKAERMRAIRVQKKARKIRFKGARRGRRKQKVKRWGSPS